MLCALFARLWNGEYPCLDGGMGRAGQPSTLSGSKPRLPSSLLSPGSGVRALDNWQGSVLCSVLTSGFHEASRGFNPRPVRTVDLINLPWLLVARLAILRLGEVLYTC